MQAGFPQTCQSCHTTSAWQPAKFDHNTFTKFPLTGAHVTVACTQCHVNGRFAGTPTDCVSCHMKDFQGTTNPNHAQAGIPTTCATCHTTTSWGNATFDHSKTGFPLTGTHVTTPCSQCHVNGNYNLTNTTCVSCHLTNYQATTNPNHVQAGFPQTCENCHNTASWTNATFDHNKTGFPLNGAHVPLQCSQCHINGNYNLTDTACVSCHLKDYQGTTDPNHVQAGLPQTCQSCHTTASWGSATFNHSTTGFPLTGAHVPLQCSQCHVNGNYNLTDTSCVSCHLKDFQGTTDPNHVQAAIPQTCQSCHSTASWGNASFNHATTGFALTGAHVPLQCSQCHVNGNYSLTSGACATCHLKDYQGTTDPNHAQAGFPQTCDSCHTTASWASATFNHATTGFTLTGRTRPTAVFAMPRKWQLQPEQHGVCYLPREGFQHHHESESRSVGISAAVRSVSQHDGLEPSTFNHTNTAFPLTGKHTTVPGQLPRERQVHSVPTDCYSCHHRLPEHHQSEPCGSGIPDDLPHLPHLRGLDGGDVQSHLVPDQPRKRGWRMHHLSYQFVRLFGIFMHQMPRQSADRLESPRRQWLCVQQPELLPMPSQWTRRLDRMEPGLHRTAKSEKCGSEDNAEFYCCSYRAPAPRARRRAQ